MKLNRIFGQKQNFELKIGFVGPMFAKVIFRR